MTNQAEEPKPEGPEREGAALPDAGQETVASAETADGHVAEGGVPDGTTIDDASAGDAVSEDAAPPDATPEEDAAADDADSERTVAEDADAEVASSGAVAEASPTGSGESAPEAGAGDAPADTAPPGAEGDDLVAPETAAPAGVAPDMAEEPLDPVLLAEGVRIAEALVFASDRPVTSHMLAAVLPEGLTAAPVMAALAEACEGRGVTLTEVAGGWAFRTAADLAQRLTKVVQAPRRLPRAAMEALSIIAYHQPCTRGEIEEIRGAALAQTTLEALLELGLVAPRGRREVPGRPTLWGTTPKFLEQFGLKALSDLPRKEELVTAETAPVLPLAPEPAEPKQGE